MKRKFNESVELDVVRLKKAHPGISANAVARQLQRAGANIDERKERNKVYMVIEGLSTNDIANELYKIRDIKKFLNESASFPRYEDVILEGYGYDIDECCGNWKAKLKEHMMDAAEDEMQEGANIFYLIDGSGSMWGDGEDIFLKIFNDILTIEKTSQVNMSAGAWFATNGNLTTSDIELWDNETPNNQIIKQLCNYSLCSGTDIPKNILAVTKMRPPYYCQTYKKNTTIMVITDGEECSLGGFEILRQIPAKILKDVVFVIINNRSALPDISKDLHDFGGVWTNNIICICREDYYKDAIVEKYDYNEDDELNDCSGPDCDDDLDECGIDECGIYNEDEDFDECEKFDECGKFESYRRPSRRGRSLSEARRLMARRKGCCPPKRSIRKISLSEALGNRKSRYNGLNESIINRAIKKAINENRKGGNRRLEEAKRALGPAKCKLIINALKSKKSYLYENKKINGKRMNRYTSKQLYNIMKTVNEQKKRIERKLTVLNESLSAEEIRQLKEQYKLKSRLIKLLDEELTYRLTLKKLLREADENPLEPLPMGPEVGEGEGDVDPDDDVEGTEEVELSRVVITLDSQEAADEFIEACVNEGIPEDVLEIEEDEEDTDEEDTTEDTEEDTEGNEDENKDEQPNESYHFRKFKRLLEADGDEESDDTESDDTEDNEETDDDNTEDETDDTEKNNSEVKVVLTDTDYIDKMAAVLSNVYGIEKEEFEESIGGEIVSDDEDSDDEDTEEDNDEKKSDNKKSEKKSSKGDDAVDALTDDDLKDLFGGE